MDESSDSGAATRDSLAGRMLGVGGAGLQALRGRIRLPRWDSEAGASAWPTAVVVALLLAAGPLVTAGRAAYATWETAAEAARLGDQAAPRVAAARAAEAARAELRTQLRRPTLGATVETLARTLPADASLAQISQSADGALEIEIATPDPDSLRSALRRSPDLTGLREVAQRRGDARMLVTFRAGA